MGKKAKQMAALFMAGAVITGMTEMPLRVYAEEEPQKVEEKLIETDEYGNVYEIEPEIGLVEEDKSIRMARSSSAQIVNFNTKGAVVTGIEGTTVDGMDALQEQLQYYKAGEKVKITVQTQSKNGEYEKRDVEVTLGKQSE